MPNGAAAVNVIVPALAEQPEKLGSQPTLEGQAANFTLRAPVFFW
jgi:hypothetical protein